MKKINYSDIEKFTKTEKRGRKPKNEKLYEELRKMEIGELFFMSKEEWRATEYKTKSFYSWMTILKNQTREKHKSQLAKYNFKIATFEEGWTIEKTK